MSSVVVIGRSAEYSRSTIERTRFAMTVGGNLSFPDVDSLHFDESPGGYVPARPAPAFT
jgi:hypothetical protein